MSSGFISTGSSSVALELGKAFPNSNDKPCKVTPQCPPTPPWEAQSVQPWSWTLHGWKKAGTLRTEKEELEKAARSPRPCSGLQFCSSRRPAILSLHCCLAEAAGPGDQRLSHSVVSDSVTPRTAARQASLSITNSWRLEVSKLQPWTKSSTLLIFVNGALLGHSHTQLFTACLRLLS